MQGQVKAYGSALSRACGARLAGLPDARCPRWCTRGQAERKLSARRPLEGNNRASETDQIASLTNVRFRGQKGHADCTAKCPLMTQSGSASSRKFFCSVLVRVLHSTQQHGRLWYGALGGPCGGVKSLPTYRCSRPTKFELPKNSQGPGADYSFGRALDR
jgi:hypothetical protein